MFGQPPPRGLPWFLGIMYRTASTRAGSLTRRVSSTTTVRPLTRLSRFSMPITLGGLPGEHPLGPVARVGPAAQRDHRRDRLAAGGPAGEVDGERVQPERCSSGEASPAYAPTWTTMLLAAAGDGVLPPGEGAVRPVRGERGGLVGVPGFDPPGGILSGDEGLPSACQPSCRATGCRAITPRLAASTAASHRSACLASASMTGRPGVSSFGDSFRPLLVTARRIRRVTHRRPSRHASSTSWSPSGSTYTRTGNSHAHATRAYPAPSSFIR